MRTLAVTAGILLACGLVCSPAIEVAGVAHAAAYPAKGIDVIVPFAPGAGTDLMGRVIAEGLAKRWKVPVNVVNKPGGNTVIGTAEVMRAKPDGYTLLVDSPGSSSMQVGMKDLPYKVESRVFVARGATSPMALVVPKDSPWKSLKDVAEAGKKDTGSLSWTSLGGTSGVDLVMRQFFAAAGIEGTRAKMVTYPGAAPAINSVAGGHVQFGAATAGAVLPLVSSGNLRAIAVTSPERVKDLPDVATTGQQGFPSVNVLYWVGFSGPPNLPAAVIRAWADAIPEVLKEPEVVTKLERVTSVPGFLGAEEFKQFILGEARMVQELIK
ncbi:MAG TPA: tripartite tricarboxylate transporter substrate binding protein [Candidatus Sulfotelmatobacter sp.]|nr:tripartite tricarboxylate transporter substrate binding protein [Candidatus Sulfotelmatobacter sp.]